MSDEQKTPTSGLTSDDDSEERMQRFIDVLVDGGTLVLHPDTWTEFKRAMLALPSELSTAVLRKRIDVMVNEYVAPGMMIAYKPKKFEFTPTFKFTELKTSDRLADWVVRWDICKDASVEEKE